MVFKKVVKFSVLMLLIPLTSFLLFLLLSIYARADALSYADRVKYTNLSRNIGAAGAATAYNSGTHIEYYNFNNVYLFQIPDTSLGEQYIVSFDFEAQPIGTRLFGVSVTRLNLLGGSLGTIGTVLTAANPSFNDGSSLNHYTLYWGSSASSTTYSQIFRNLGTSGHIEHTINAVDGATYLTLGTGNLAVQCMVDYTTSWTMAAGEMGSLVVPTPLGDQAHQAGIALTNISVKKVVGGDELLDETKKQTGILEDQKEIMEEQAETTKGIFAKITDFFDNFFSRLGDFIKGLIIPTSEELTAFLQEVNDWFSDRLGFIWYPFSLAIDLVTALAGGSADSQIIIPAFRLTVAGVEYTIWGDIPVNMDEMNIFRYVRFFTSAILAAGTVHMAIDKWDEWIGGHGTG